MLSGWVRLNFNGCECLCVLVTEDWVWSGVPLWGTGCGESPWVNFEASGNNQTRNSSKKYCNLRWKIRTRHIGKQDTFDPPSENSSVLLGVCSEQPWSHQGPPRCWDKGGCPLNWWYHMYAVYSSLYLKFDQGNSLFWIAPKWGHYHKTNFPHTQSQTFINLLSFYVCCW